GTCGAPIVHRVAVAPARGGNMWVIERVAVRTVCKLWCTATVACLSAVWADPAAAQVPGIEVTQRWASRGGPRNPFDEIRGMVEDGAGRIWVSDGRAGVLHELTATGRHVRVVGRRGEGRGGCRAPGRGGGGGGGRAGGGGGGGGGGASSGSRAGWRPSGRGGSRYTMRRARRSRCWRMAGPFGACSSTPRW